jgi:hypothetical protein
MVLEDGRYEILFSCVLAKINVMTKHTNMLLGHTPNIREKNVNHMAHHA